MTANTLLPKYPKVYGRIHVLLFLEPLLSGPLYGSPADKFYVNRTVICKFCRICEACAYLYPNTLLYKNTCMTHSYSILVDVYTILLRKLHL